MLPFEAHLMAAGWPKTRRGALHAARLREMAGEVPQVRSWPTGAPQDGVCSYCILTRRGARFMLLLVRRVNTQSSLY